MSKSRAEYSRQWRYKNREKASATQRAYRAKLTPEMRALRRRKRLYKVTEEFIFTLFTFQDGACALCRRSITLGPDAHVDHCHETKEPRGLLCQACNHAEGNIRKTGLKPKEFAARLEAYLAEPPAAIAKLV